MLQARRTAASIHPLQQPWHGTTNPASAIGTLPSVRTGGNVTKVVGATTIPSSRARSGDQIIVVYAPEDLRVWWMNRDAEIGMNTVIGGEVPPSRRVS